MSLGIPGEKKNNTDYRFILMSGHTSYVNLDEVTLQVLYLPPGGYKELKCTVLVFVKYSI